ncbi:hypothetical protein H257_18947, partial [Aphanomyces astaci]
KSIVHKQEQAKARKARGTATKTVIRAMRTKPIKTSKRDTFTFANARLREAHEAVNPFVKIGESTIPGAGRGMFAAIDMLLGDICTAYDGTKVFVEPKDHAYAGELAQGRRQSSQRQRPKKIREPKVDSNGNLNDPAAQVKVMHLRDHVANFVVRTESNHAMFSNIEYVQQQVKINNWDLNC